MTIIAAYMDDDHVVIGCDSMASTTYVKYEAGTKLIDRLGNYSIGLAGSCRVFDILLEDSELPNTMRDIQSVRALRDRVIELTKDLKNAEFNLVIASPFGIAGIESDHSIDFIPHDYFAAGTGEELALGSMFNSRKMDDPAALAVETAVQAAVQYSTHCGFDIHIKTYERIK